MKRDEKTSRDLEQEVQRTRARVERELRALEERLRPGQLFEQAVASLRSSNGREFIGNLGRSLRDNPLPVALTAVGLAWLAAARPSATPARRYTSAHNGEALGARLHDAAERAQGTWEDAGERIQGAWEGVGERARQLVQQAQSTAAQLGARARAQLGSGSSRSGANGPTLIEEQPLLLGIVGLAVGAGAAAWLASSRTARAAEADDERQGRAGEQAHRARTRESSERTHGRGASGIAEQGSAEPRYGESSRHTPRPDYSV